MVRSFLILTMLLAVATSVAGQGVNFSVVPTSIPLGQKLLLSFTNQSSSTIGFSNPAPWSIHDAKNQLVFSPVVITIPVSVPPRTTTLWFWDQLDMNLQPVVPGAYEARITFNLGQTTLKAPFTIEDVSLTLSGQATPGGTLTLNLRAPQAAGMTYQTALAFSDSGISLPGKRVLSLAPDPLFFVSLLVGPPVFEKFAGVLDSTGSGVSKLNIPNTSALVGVQAFAAFATYHPSGPGGIFNHSASQKFQIK